MVGKLLLIAVFSILLFGGDSAKTGPGGGGGGAYQINQLRFRLKIAQQQILTSIKTANSTIQKSVASSRALLDKRIGDLQTKSESSGCVLNVPKITSDPVEECDQATQLQAAQTKTLLLYSLHAQISTVYLQCPIWSPTYQECVQNLCDDITKQMNELVEVNKSDVDKAISDANACIENNQNGILKEIDDANNALDNC